MPVNRDIQTREDIVLLVDQFYLSVKSDALIGPVFHQVIQNRWDEHLPKMYQFWESVLLDNPVYKGRPFPPHRHLPIEKVHFDRWLQLFKATLDTHFYGEAADKAYAQALLMARLFESKLAYFRAESLPPNLLDRQFE